MVDDMEHGYFVHESSLVDDGAVIGAGTKIWHFSHVMGTARIGQKCNIGQNVYVDRGVVVGDNVKIQNNVSLYTGVIIEDDVFLGPSAVLTNVINPRSHVPRKDEFRTTLIRCGASVGANATIVCGVELSEYAFVGAGSVVTQNIPAYALVYGAPARQQAWICHCGIKLPLAVGDDDRVASCSSCRRAFRLKDGLLNPQRTEQ